MAATHSDDYYWHQISLYLNQLEGLEGGYFRGAKRARSDLEEEIPFSDFLLMNSAADIQDLKIYYENYVLEANNATLDNEEGPKNFYLPSATMLTKIFRNEGEAAWQLLFGHSTAGSYASMLRIQKRYKFHYHFTPNQRTNTVPGVDITFTGYPGILGSTDDFYIVKGRQVQSIVAGVGIKNENVALWKNVNITDAVPLAARVMAANRIAQNRKTWGKAMSRHPFTGSKQWVTVDLLKLSATDSAEDKQNQTEEVPVPVADRLNANKGLVWIVEQLPGKLHFKDVSENFLLTPNSTWIANGVPYFEDVLAASGISKEELSHELSADDNAQLTNLEAVDKYLRTHGFRGDLLGEEAAMAYGNIDIKLYAYNARIGISDYHAIAGPIFMRLQHIPQKKTNIAVGEISNSNADSAMPSALMDERLSVSIDDAAEMSELEMITEKRPVRNDMRALAMLRQMGPFKWSEVTDKISGIEHAGHPDEWNFGKVSPKWAW